MRNAKRGWGRAYLQVLQPARDLGAPTRRSINDSDLMPSGSHFRWPQSDYGHLSGKGREKPTLDNEKAGNVDTKSEKVKWRRRAGKIRLLPSCLGQQLPYMQESGLDTITIKVPSKVNLSIWKPSSWINYWFRCLNIPSDTMKSLSNSI